MKYFLISLICCCLSSIVFGQKPTATLSGKVFDDGNKPLSDVSVVVENFAGGTKTDENGNFNLKVPVAQIVTIVFSSIGYETKKIFKRFEKDEKMNYNVSLKKRAVELKGGTVRSDKKRNEAGNVAISAKNYYVLPSVTGGIEGLLKIFLSNNNELTSQYNVRGGNFDENLVYINDFEVYRPFLTRSGQQEGLSAINADLVSGVNFSTGGFQSKYGDKMSSVLDITTEVNRLNARTANIGFASVWLLY